MTLLKAGLLGGGAMLIALQVTAAQAQGLNSGPTMPTVLPSFNGSSNTVAGGGKIGGIPEAKRSPGVHPGYLIDRQHPARYRTYAPWYNNAAR